MAGSVEAKYSSLSEIWSMLLHRTSFCSISVYCVVSLMSSLCTPQRITAHLHAKRSC